MPERWVQEEGLGGLLTWWGCFLSGLVIDTLSSCQVTLSLSPSLPPSQGLLPSSLSLLHSMRQQGLTPNQRTYACAILAAGRSGECFFLRPLTTSSYPCYSTGIRSTCASAFSWEKQGVSLSVRVQGPRRVQCPVSDSLIRVADPAIPRACLRLPRIHTFAQATPGPRTACSWSFASWQSSSSSSTCPPLTGISGGSG